MKRPIHGVDCKGDSIVEIDPIALEFSTSVVPVVFRRAGQLVSGQGTAFCVIALGNGEAVFATAKHVVETLEHADDIEPFVLLPKGLATDVEKKSLVGVRIHQISMADTYSDVALITIDVNQSEHPVTTSLSHIPLTFDSPRVGQKCLGLGYPQQAGVIGYRLMATQGEIEEIHPSRRDRLSNFPSFRSNAKYRSGMSGGPIINQNGHVIGVISRGTGDDYPGTPLGYGACIAGIAELKVGLHENRDALKEFKIDELASMGIIGQQSETTVTLERANDGVVLKWTDT